MQHHAAPYPRQPIGFFVFAVRGKPNVKYDAMHVAMQASACGIATYSHLCLEHVQVSSQTCIEQKQNPSSSIDIRCHSHLITCKMISKQTPNEYQHQRKYVACIQRSGIVLDVGTQANVAHIDMFTRMIGFPKPKHDAKDKLLSSAANPNDSIMQSFSRSQ